MSSLRFLQWVLFAWGPRSFFPILHTFGPPPLPQGLASTGSSVLAFGGIRCDIPMFALDFGQLGSSLASHSFARLDAFAFLSDFSNHDFFLFLRSASCPGALSLAFSGARSEAPFAALDSLHSGIALLLKGLVYVDPLFSCLGRLRLEPLSFLLDVVLTGLSLLLQSFGHAGALLLISGSMRAGSLLPLFDGMRLGASLPLKGMSCLGPVSVVVGLIRFGVPAPALSFSQLEAVISVHRFLRSGLGSPPIGRSNLDVLIFVLDMSCLEPLLVPQSSAHLSFPVLVMGLTRFGAFPPPKRFARIDLLVLSSVLSRIDHAALVLDVAFVWKLCAVKKPLLPGACNVAR